MSSRISKVKERLKALSINAKQKAKSRKSAYELFIGGPLASYKRRVAKEKAELAKEGQGIRYVAFFLTLISITLALSFIPFFPQPLPALVAVLVAFIVYITPGLGMSIGAIPIVLGLLYHLSLVDFIAFLGPPIVRVLFICILIFFFVALPVRFRRYEDAVGINIGIIAAALLFFNETFFLAIPLLVTSIVLLKRTQSGLSVAYYVLISVPMMLVQYFQYVLTVARVDFWNELDAVPPIFTSLSGVFSNMQGASMLQFRMFDMSKTLGRITWEVIANPTPGIHTVSQAVNQYVDSFPGMILFLVMVGGLVWAVSIILPSLVSKSAVSRAETLFPALAAMCMTGLFFFFMLAMQVPMAFSANVSVLMAVVGTLSALAFAIPASLLNFAPKKKAEVEKNCEIILVKAGNLLAKLRASEALLLKIKEAVPVDVSGPETKLEIIMTNLDEIISRAKERKFKVPETYEKITELDKNVAQGIESLAAELDTLVKNYQLTLNYEYTAWIKKLEEVGYPVKTPVKISFQKEQPTEERIQYISAILAYSRQLANEFCNLASQVYEVIQAMYDPTLPPESRTVIYLRQKLADKASPWIACDAIIAALKNWKRQYSGEIEKSITLLQNSLTIIGDLSAEERLPEILGEKYALVNEQVSRAQELKAVLEKSTNSLLTIMIFKQTLQSTLNAATQILSTLDEDMTVKEKSIESLQPFEDFWEKNPTLREQIAEAITAISDNKYSLRERMKALPSALDYISPSLWTISQYNQKNELMLNYPVAKTAIEGLLKKQPQVSAADLPFTSSDAEHYLKLYYNERKKGLLFDEGTLQLSKA